jgi:hypothetical protein
MQIRILVPFAPLSTSMYRLKTIGGMKCTEQETCEDCPIIKSFYIASILLKTEHQQEFEGQPSNGKNSDLMYVEEGTTGQSSTENDPDDLTSRAGLASVKAGSLVGPTLATLYDLTVRRVVKKWNTRDDEQGAGATEG